MLLRDGYMCQMCGKAITERANVDHIKRWTHRDDPNVWDVSNLQALHQDCHSVKTHSLDLGRKAKGCDADGMPLHRVSD